MHTDSSVLTFQQATKDIGRAFRTFAKDTSRAFETVELPREREARIRREAKKPTRGGRKFQGPAMTKKKSHMRYFNNNTAKTHAIGDYPWAVKYYGTLDGYDTKIVSPKIFLFCFKCLFEVQGEQEHKRVKSYYGRTNRNKHQGQIARHEYRVRCLRRMKQRRKRNRHTILTVEAWEEERLPPADPDEPYQMASGRKFFLELDEFTRLAKWDPAAIVCTISCLVLLNILIGLSQDFARKLRHYVLCEIFKKDPSITFSEAEYNAVNFENQRIYKHKVVRINYTTYDLRRGQDSINPRTHPDIMCLAPTNSPHPFSYGRVVGVFHVNVRFTSPPSSSLPSVSRERVDMLWVRWFEYDTSYMAGWQAKRLHRIHFIHALDSGAFGLLHPRDVVRAIHLIPAFHHMGDDHGLPEDSIGRQYESPSYAGPRELEVDDWKYYHVNM
jgi:hypothetical protein